MKIQLVIALSASFCLPLLQAQVTTGTPTVITPEGDKVIVVKDSPDPQVVVTTPGSTAVVVETKAVSQETLNVLRDIRRIAPDREAEIQAALKLESDAEANLLLDTILADAEDDIRKAQRARFSLDVVERTEQERQEYIDYMTRRLRGQAALTEAPTSFRSRVMVAPADPAVTAAPRQTRYYGEGRRIITYRTRAEIPPVLLANGTLKRVEIAEVGGSPFRNDLILVDDMSPEYIAPTAYAVSYYVNPESEITRDDILFTQGTTDFADAYSYDVVVDLAMAMQDPSLQGSAFVIEGHASSEGDYSENLLLSQYRAERIARELIRQGVPSSQLIPVGYGETNAVHPATAEEGLRATDRRVTVFSLRR